MGESDAWKQIGNELSDAILRGLRQAREQQEGQRDPADLDERDEALIEALAAHCHDEQWSGWMRYMFGKGTENEDGSLTIPSSWHWRWKYQTQTPYSELPEGMKESDREEARAILRLLKEPNCL